MPRTRLQLRALPIALLVALAPAPSTAIAPALLMMIKQAAQQAATSMIKDTLLSGVSGMGCKGAALSNALNGLDLRRAAGIGVPTLPVGMAMPMGGGLPGMTAEMKDRLGTLMPDASKLPAGTTVDPQTFARLQQAIAQPLSPAETLAAIDELSELGLMPIAMKAELGECMALMPQAAPTLGMAMGMLKPMIPQLRQARDQLHALSPEEQDEVAIALAEELRAQPPDERATMLEQLDAGFFPARVRQATKAALAR
jgi:hypothetical protein